MDTPTFFALLLACAPAVAPGTAQALVQAESSFNPHAIGVVGGRLERQPRSRPEAVATAHRLLADGWNFSLGLAQINRHNFERLGLSIETALEPCSNVRAMQAVLLDCFARAGQRPDGDQHRLRRALSCYYSGNFTTGFKRGYVQRVVRGSPANTRD